MDGPTNHTHANPQKSVFSRTQRPQINVPKPMANINDTKIKCVATSSGSCGGSIYCFERKVSTKYRIEKKTKTKMPSYSASEASAAASVSWIFIVLLILLFVLLIVAIVYACCKFSLLMKPTSLSVNLTFAAIRRQSGILFSKQLV